MEKMRRCNRREMDMAKQMSSVATYSAYFDNKTKELTKSAI